MNEFDDPFRIEDEDGQWKSTKPWSEKEWVRYQRATATIFAKRQELQETLKSHPEDKEQIEADIEFVSRDFPRSPHYDTDFEKEAKLRQSDLICLEDQPVWQHAENWKEAAISDFGPVLREFANQTSDVARAVDWLFCEMCDPVHKLESGRDQGFADAYLCANILCCREALKIADSAVVNLQKLMDQGILSTETGIPLIEQGQIVAVLIEAWIQELCERVWWD